MLDEMQQAYRLKALRFGMTLQPPSRSSDGIGTAAPGDIVAATEALFEEIAGASHDPLAKTSILALNEQLRPLRPYEDAFFTDRQAEYDALADCWRRRDMTALLPLINAYFERRQVIKAQWAELINRPS